MNYSAKVVSGPIDPEPYIEASKHLQYEDGSVNWGAAARADPGACSCPYCEEIYLIISEVMECGKCKGHFKAYGEDREVKRGRI